MSNNTKQLEIFTVWSDEIENRLDPFFYRPIFKKLVATINNAKRKALALGDIVEFSVAGDWGEDPNTFEPNPEYQLCYVLRNTNFDNKYNLNFDDVAQRYVKNGKVEKLALQKGEILIEKSGGSPVQPVGRVAFVEDLPFDKPVVFSNFLQKIRIASGSYLPEYVFTFLQAIYHLGYTEFLQNQTTGIKNLRLDDFLKIKIAELSKDEQKKIAKFAFDARCKAQKMEEDAQQILTSIDSFVLGELGIDIAGGHERERERVSETAPETYVIWSDEIERRIDPNFYRPYFKNLLRAIQSKNNVPLGELVEFSNEAWDQKSIFTDIFPYIEISAIDLKTGDIAEIEPLPVADAPSRAKMIVRQDDIIVSTTRPNRGAIAKIEKEQDGSIASTGFAVLRGMKTEKISKEFLFVMLRSVLSLKQMEQRVTGGNYPAITAEDLKQIRIVVPDKAGQEKITSGVQSSYSKMRTLRAQAAEVLESTQKQVEQMILV